MFSYIASFLGVQARGDTTLSNNATSQSSPPPAFVCDHYGWYPKPDPAVRLRVSGVNDRVVRIFGYPPQKDFPKSMWYPPPDFGNNDVYIHYLLSEGLANVKYVMGDDWRSQLRQDYQDPSKQSVPNGGVILRPSTVNEFATLDPAAEEEEREHSLRMRRCGAVAVCTEIDTRHYDSTTIKSVPRYLFGWPASGGVWAIRSPWSMPLPEVPNGYPRTDEEILEWTIRKADIRDTYYSLARNVKKLDSMEDVCHLLEESGAQFYETIADCPEAVELNLV